MIGMSPLAGTRLSAIRDRALLLIGFAGAFRRSELVALDLEDHVIGRCLQNEML